jgi:hypothetical protein
MKIRRVEANNRKRTFEVRTYRATYPLPYALVTPTPTSDNRIRRVYVDEELGREGFTYELDSGVEGSVHMDAVLEYNEDPRHLADLMIYRLTLEAQQRLDASSLSTREVARRLGTSPSQIYRLLDPTNYRKSVRQMASLLSILGCDVEVRVTERPPAEHGRRRLAS